MWSRLAQRTACPPTPPPERRRLTQYAREARREYGELATRDLSGLKDFVKGLPLLQLLDRLSDLLGPVAEVRRAAGGRQGWASH